MIIHVVKAGDSIYSIAKMHKVPMNKIIRDNGLDDPEHLVIGQTLVIISGPTEHIVKSGESLYSISRIYDVPVNQLIEANPQIQNPAQLKIGETVYIPEVKGRLGSIEVNGYSYPGINPDVLAKTLPDLTYLSIFAYKVKADGTMDTIVDQPLINAARKAKVAPMMVIANIKETGGFSSEIGHAILTDEAIQDKLINNIIGTLKSKNYYGLDVDFEYIYPEDREKYNAFLRKIRARLSPLGYILIHRDRSQE